MNTKTQNLLAKISSQIPANVSLPAWIEKEDLAEEVKSGDIEFLPLVWEQGLIDQTDIDHLDALSSTYCSEALWEALSSLDRLWGDTSEGESHFEAQLWDNTLSKAKVLVMFGSRVGMRALISAIDAKPETHWVNVNKEDFEPIRKQWEERLKIVWPF